MRKCKRSWILAGILLVTLAGCRPTTEEETNPDSAEESQPTPGATAVTQLATATPFTTYVPPPPPKPTPQPTSAPVENGSEQQIGGTAVGLEIGLPLDWVNLSGELNVSSATTPVGLSVLLLADSQRTGLSLLAGKKLGSGAFGVGLITNQPLSSNDPITALTRLIADQEAVTPLNQAQTFTAADTSGAITGAVIDMTGDLLGFFSSGGNELHSRLFLFLSPTGSSVPDGRTATLVLLSAPTGQWEQYADRFDEMARAIVIHDVQAGYTLNAGTANVLGNLTNGKGSSGKLIQGTQDVWTFTIDEPRYATLSLTPDNKELDLTLTIISPSGQTITRVDGGYAGDTEVVADLYLTENGRYVVEVSDFFNQPGRYILSLNLDKEPRFTSAGVIRPGQGIQSTLPVNAQHVWTFNGTAGQLISIVLTPDDNQMDAILNLFGPDGSRLVALDEGFSGDAEVISGFELPVTGSYSILVTSFAGSGGAYTLALDEGGEATQNFYDAGDLVYGDAKSEALRSSEAHAWFFDGRAGDAIRITVRPLNDVLDLDVWLYDPDIQRLTAIDELAAGDTETIRQTLPRDGQYLILVREFFGAAGSYEISLSAVPATEPVFAGQVSYGETVAGTLAPEQMALWQFYGNEKDVIDIELTPGTAADDVVFELQDPSGSTVLAVDAVLAGQSETLNGFTITADGLWGVVVKDFFAEESAYSLTVKRTR